MSLKNYLNRVDEWFKPSVYCMDSDCTVDGVLKGAGDVIHLAYIQCGPNDLDTLRETAMRCLDEYANEAMNQVIKAVTEWARAGNAEVVLGVGLSPEEIDAETELYKLLTLRRGGEEIPCIVTIADEPDFEGGKLTFPIIMTCIKM